MWQTRRERTEEIRSPQLLNPSLLPMIRLGDTSEMHPSVRLLFSPLADLAEGARQFSRDPGERPQLWPELTREANAGSKEDF